MTKKRYIIRTKNESLCLETIINKQGLSRAELSNITGLTKTTISQIVKKLLEDHLVTEVGTGSSGTLGGRKPIKLEYNGKAGLSISIDVGYNYINALLTYLDGETISFQQKITKNLNQETVKNYFFDVFSYFDKIKPTTHYDIISVAIAIHGPVYNNNIIFTPHYILDKIPFRKITEELVDYPVFLENESNLSALGEYTFSSNFSDLISINMHSGIGTGIVRGGVLQTGAHGFSGEIGHQIIVPDGIKCECGNKGCLEIYASNKACFDRFEKLKKIDFVNAVILKEFYLNNDENAHLVVKENVKYLSIGINNAIAHFDPEVIVLNSSIYREIPEMIPMIKEKLSNRFSKNIIIVNSVLTEKAPLLGGLVLNLQHFLNIKHIKLK